MAAEVVRRVCILFIIFSMFQNILWSIDFWSNERQFFLFFFVISNSKDTWGHQWIAGRQGYYYIICECLHVPTINSEVTHTNYFTFAFCPPQLPTQIKWNKKKKTYGSSPIRARNEESRLKRFQETRRRTAHSILLWPLDQIITWRYALIDLLKKIYF